MGKVNRIPDLVNLVLLLATWTMAMNWAGFRALSPVTIVSEPDQTYTISQNRTGYVTITKLSPYCSMLHSFLLWYFLSYHIHMSQHACNALIHRVHLTKILLIKNNTSFLTKKQHIRVKIVVSTTNNTTTPDYTLLVHYAVADSLVISTCVERVEYISESMHDVGKCVRGCVCRTVHERGCISSYIRECC